MWAAQAKARKEKEEADAANAEYETK